MLRWVKNNQAPAETEKKGFTIIEVMLVLAVAAMLFIAVLGGAFSNIATQRFNDAIRGFAEFLRQNYSEAISPESIGTAEADDLNLGYSEHYAIYGKVLFFGLSNEDKVARSDEQDTVYSVTLVGDVHPTQASKGFITDLQNAHVSLYCGDGNTGGVSTLSSFNPDWQTKIMMANDEETGARSEHQFQGMIIIARSPTSGVVHTAYAKADPAEYASLKDDIAALKANANNNNFCYVDESGSYTSANTYFQKVLALTEEASDEFKFKTTEDVSFCLKSEANRLLREVRLITDGHNTSAVSIIDDAEDKCE